MSVFKREVLAEWLAQVAAGKQLVAPTTVDGILLYRPVEGVKDLAWDFSRPVLSAKEVFFPATERLLAIEKTGQTIHLQNVVPDQALVLFGVRPCDARGIAALDALFIESDPVDVNYARRREGAVIIGMACQEVGDTCFCTRVGGAPDDPTGMDIMLKELNGGYEVQAITAKGREICEQAGLQPQAPEQRNPVSPFPLPTRSAWPAHFNDDVWAAMAERCLSCRICAYVCPTCRCFDVRDEVAPSDNGHKVYERIRCWDSCTRQGYRRIAGGHNPRAEKGQRLRNRFFCKFFYYQEQYGPLGCTGCGRCIDSCPVNIDITEVMDYIQASEGVE